MDENISPETEERIRELCSKISVAHNLDEEIQRELFSHMEDKLLAYLSGSEKLTEEDAFVLVREHFGDPEEVKAMLENVHAEAAQVGVMRRIGVALAATLGIGILLNVASYIIQFPVHVIFGVQKNMVWWPGYAYIILNPVILYIILNRWKKEEKSGGRKWFQTISPFMLIVVVGACFLVDTVIPIAYSAAHFSFLHATPFYSESFLKGHVTIVSTHHANPGSLMIFFFGRNITLDRFFFASLSLFAMLAQCIIWLWWCDGASRRFIARAATVGAWIVFVFLASTYQPAFGFGHDAAGLVRTFIDWRRDNIPAFTANTVFFGVGVLMLYILAGRVLDKMKRTRNHEIV